MKRPAKYGWFFSVFAGIFATASIYVTSWLMSIPSPPLDAILYFGACAFLAARVAGWIARTLGWEDYGWVAGACSAVIFSLIIRLPVVMLKAVDPAYHLPDWIDLIPRSFDWLLLSSLFILPFCIVGTAVFIVSLHLLRQDR